MLQVNSQGHFQYASTSWFARALGLLHASGVEGVAVDVWVSSSWEGRTICCTHRQHHIASIIVLHGSLFMYQALYEQICHLRQECSPHRRSAPALNFANHVTLL